MMEVSSVAKVEGLEKEKGEQVEVEDEDEIELSLELSIGRKTYTKSNPLHNKSMDSSSSSCPKIGGLDFTEDAQISVLPRSVVAHIDPATDQQSKREIQALRRQEARKNREEKLKNKTIPRGKKGHFCCVNGDKERRENHDDEEDIVVLDEEEAEPPRKKEKNEKMVQNHEEEEVVVKNLSLTLINNGSNSMGQMQYPYRPALQYLPFTNGFVYPYGVVPCWGPVAAGNGSGTGGNEGQEKEKRVNLGNNGGTEWPDKEKKVSFEPAACRSFRPYNRNSEQNGNGKLDGSSGGSSSAVSDYQNSSLQGGNNISDTGSSSSKFPQENLNDLSAGRHDPQEGKSENECDSNGMKSNEAEEKATTNHIANMVSSSIHQCSEEPKSATEEADPLNQSIIISTKYHPIPPATLKEETTNGVIGKPPNIPQTEHHGALSLPQMPCVSTTGNGPNGKTITGFLYRYTKTEVSIVCVCHGTSFSPAEFVEHAGGVDVAHPLRHITVIPSAFV